MIYKGKIASIDTETRTARIIPDDTPEKTVPNIIVPVSMTNRLSKGDSVVYAWFQDGEGVIIIRMDGEDNG